MSATLKYVSSGKMGGVMGCSRRTVNGYCLDGLYPGAFQTMGGHWRIPEKYFREVQGQISQGIQINPDQTGKTGKTGETGKPGTHPVDG